MKYAKANDAIILFDAAYEAFIQDPAIPHSIFEIEGARDCAIEFRSFSKNGGFTGVRCAYIVIPKTVTGKADDGSRVPLHPLWSRRHSTKFNGASYPVQRGADALFTDEGKAAGRARSSSTTWATPSSSAKPPPPPGSRSSAVKTRPTSGSAAPRASRSWDMFDKMFGEAQVVITPGSGFGSAGEGYFRISAFNSRANVEEVCRRLKALVA